MAKGKMVPMVREEHDRRLAQAWSNLLGTEAGRYVMHDLLSRCGVNATTYSADSAHSAFLEGRRSLGLELQAVYLAPQGARLHGAMLIEAEARASELMAAFEYDKEHQDEHDDF